MGSKDYKTYYDILEVPPNAATSEIFDGYIKAKNAYSQDGVALYSLMTEEECREMLNSIEEAYSVISDPQKRKEYDRVRGINASFEEESRSYDSLETEVKIAVGQSAPFSRGGIERGLEHGREKSRGEEKNKISQIKKIVSSKKFSLEFEINHEIEKRIESTTEFSGKFLQFIREYKNVDIPRMAEMTKVSKTYIKSIEEENMEMLPALVYVRGFVYQYAKCLKLNPDFVATSYIHRLQNQNGETGK